MPSFLILVLIATWGALLFNILLTLTLVRRMNAVTAIFKKQPDLAVGAPAPDFKAETIAQETVTLATYANRTALFVFIHPHCQACRDELPMLQPLALTAKRRAGIELVLVSEGTVAETRALVAEFKLTLPVVIAPRESNSFAQDYNPNGENPCYCMVDGQGMVVSKEIVGSRKWLSLRQALEGPTESIEQHNRAAAMFGAPQNL